MFTNLMTMQLKITPDRFISEIQKDFTDNFPFLKLEFFNNKSLPVMIFLPVRLFQEAEN